MVQSTIHGPGKATPVVKLEVVVVLRCDRKLVACAVIEFAVCGACPLKAVKAYEGVVAVEPAERRLRHACIKPGVHEGIVLQATDLREFDIRIRIHSVSAAETHFVAEVIAVAGLYQPHIFAVVG